VYLRQRYYVLIEAIEFEIILKVGITLPQTGRQATRENVIHTAQQAEKEGFDSLWVFERLLWPINPQTPCPATPDGSLPIEYQIMLDPLETLTYVAANTNKIALGTNREVIDMLFHNPVVLARRFATLDVLSGGRTICGLGIGWSKDEYQVSDIPFKDRGKRADEFIQALKRCCRIYNFQLTSDQGIVTNMPPGPTQRPFNTL
jgi:alkanesulfonate monooxygenase SsuD/methylene tetrahydromethanopterin reductase-like flavin-dependent oxidoreductase (luciferase family)